MYKVAVARKAAQISKQVLTGKFDGRGGDGVPLVYGEESGFQKNSPPDSPVLKRIRVQSRPAGSTTARWLSLLSCHDFERRRNDVKVTMDWVGDHSSALRNGAEFLCPSLNLTVSRHLVR